MLDKDDIETGNKFMSALKKNLEKGNSKLAYALGKAVLRSPAGKANNGDFEDLPLGELGSLRDTLFAFSTIKDTETGKKSTRPECVAINRQIDSII